MITLTHIINPVAAKPDSRFYFIQQITFHSMLTAQKHARDQIVNLQTAQYPEDHNMILSGFSPTPDLTRSVLDVAQFKIPRKLPLLQDIMERVYTHSSSEYVIYSNVDIGIQPHFYNTIVEIINQGFDAFVINRRTISNQYTSIAQMDDIYRETGKPHRGWDCFVFPRKWIIDFKLGKICIGIPLIGLALVSNLITFSINYKEFKDEYLTFHLGDDKAWNQKAFSDYHQHNYTQLMGQLGKLVEEYGDFPSGSQPARYLNYQSNPIKATLYRLYTRYPLPLWVAKKFKI